MSSILFEIKNSIAFITLNRPEKFNAFNRQMSLDLQEKLDECEKNISIRCVYITGAGKGFSSGQDLTEAIDPNGAEMEKIISEQYNPIIRKIRNLSKPVIAAVNGIAAGAGANVALCCDVIVAAESASFIQAFSKIGLIPDCGGTYFLPRLIGLQKSSALMMLGDKISAKEAERMGMIYQYFPDELFFYEAEKIAVTLSQLPTKGLAYTKQALNKSLEQTLEQQLETEDLLQQKAAATNDFKEGVSAFIEKRKANFKGD
ncbi:MAG TPA: enoyl-CoA hydratase-related protein [Hanamia sp.]|jgi:2-(1,2-epoxy-1,2-dihydrophenyl)acetyl-CoA isomerase|nr:enoyl-CoA hydratase-related protein [Hanamia sp.]